MTLRDMMLSASLGKAVSEHATAWNSVSASWEAVSEHAKAQNSMSNTNSLHACE